MDTLQEMAVSTLVLAKEEGCSDVLQTHIRTLYGMAKVYQNQAADLNGKYQSLIIENLVKSKSDLVENFRGFGTEMSTRMNEINRIVEVEATSVQITIPLARLLPEAKLSQARGGYVCLSLPPLGEEEYEVVILIEFFRSDETITYNEGFTVHHDIDGLVLDNWSNEGQFCATIGEAAECCRLLLAILPEPGLAYLKATDPQ